MKTVLTVTGGVVVGIVALGLLAKATLGALIALINLTFWVTVLAAIALFFKAVAGKKHQD